MELKVESKVPAAMVYNAFVGAFEGGSNYWLHSANLVKADNKPDPKRKLVWWGHESLYAAPFSFQVGYDDPDKEEGNGEGEKTISYPSDVAAGLAIMAKKAPRQFAALLAEEDDSITHDCLMQCIVLGDIIYG